MSAPTRSLPRTPPVSTSASAYTRVLAAVIIPFLAVASFLPYLLPGDTDTLFAWTIEPPLTAMLLASAYLGGIWFFGAAVRAHSWRAVRRGMPAVVVFATLLLIATLLHLDRFHAGHISFITWFMLYLTTPFLVLIAIILNRHADDGSDAAREYRIPLPLRLALVALGSTALVFGLTLFLLLELLLPAWPWTLTPLTARVLGAVLTLPGIVNLGLLVDSRWSAFRTVFQAQLFSLVFLIGALAMRGIDLDGENSMRIVFVSGIGLSFVAYAVFYAYCERHRLVIRRPGADT